VHTVPPGFFLPRYQRAGDRDTLAAAHCVCGRL
jgi:hypothetical protein